jgi:hypothetical protein
MYWFNVLSLIHQNGQTMNFVEAKYDDKMGMYFESKGYYDEYFPKLKVIDILFMYLDTDTEEDNVVTIAQIGPDDLHRHWYQGQRRVIKTGTLSYVKTFLAKAYNSIYS